MKNSIRKALTGNNARASEVYFAVMQVQGYVSLGMLALAVLFGMGVRFIVRSDGMTGFMFALLMTFIFFNLSCVVGFWSVGHVMSLGDDVIKGRDRLGRFEANSLYVEKMMKHVETAVEHRSAGGRLVGYMVGGRYIPLQKIHELLIDASGVGGFDIPGGFSDVTAE